jgi:two-component system sensor histidine kinase KdpD
MNRFSRGAAGTRPGLARLRPALALAAILALVALITALLRQLPGEPNTPVVALLYLLAVILGTTLGGLPLGAITAVTAFLAFNYFFVAPYFSLLVHRTADLLVLGAFLGVAFVVSQLLSRAQASLAAARARERETTALYELSTALAGLRDETAIARAVAEHLLALTGASQVRLAFRPQAPAIHLPDAAAPAEPPTLSLPLLTARGRLGEIELWRPDRPASPGELRLLQTFASHGALALEHNRLAQAETQARILEESDRLKSALLSSVSHELRTPLATIKAAASSLNSGEVEWQSAARAELLAAVEEETDHLNRLVGNLLDMSRIEAGVLKPRRAWLSLGEVAGAAAARLRQSLGQHRLAIDIPDDLPLVPADPVQVTQVFTNLIDNSIKYAPAGTRITITAWQAADAQAQVRVHNQGPPVTAEDLAHLFDKFHRGRGTDRVTGTGLGLSICKGLVEAHGGRIWAENQPDGLAFHFTLPLEWPGNLPPSLPRETEAE